MSNIELDLLDKLLTETEKVCSIHLASHLLLIPT